MRHATCLSVKDHTLTRLGLAVECAILEVLVLVEADFGLALESAALKYRIGLERSPMGQL